MADPLAMPDAWAERRAQIARTLDQIAVETGDRRFAHAAGILRGGKAGRPPCDDGQALGYVAALIDAGLAPSRREACRRAALLYSLPGERNRMTNRLRKKLAQK